MHWIAPLEKDTANGILKKHLSGAPNQFLANSGLKSQEYSAPVLDLIPAASVHRDFERRTGPVRLLVVTFSNRIENLRWTRDVLLRRLLSGQAPV